ncbi:hypothetical protein EV175_006372, partial [Coemansia sp. RSA 1933]
MSSGVNNIWYMPLVADTTSESNDVDRYDLSWYFGYSEDEIKLLIKKARSAKEGRLGIGNPTDADILETMRKWYNGYRIGKLTGRFNPLASVAFLKELSRNNTLKEAAQSFWGKTGGSSTITAITLRNRVLVWKLAHRLIEEYNNPTLPASFVLASSNQYNSQGAIPEPAGSQRHSQYEAPEPVVDDGQHDQSATTSPPESITLCESSLPNKPDFADCTLDELVTLFLYTGYLTLRDSTAIRIPDGELLAVWEDIKLTAVFNTDSTTERVNQRNALLRSICDGNMRPVYDQFKAIANQLSNNFHRALEAVSADDFRTFVLSKIDYGTHAGGEMHMVHIVEGECGMGKADWILVVPGRLVGREVATHVTIEFKRIEPKHAAKPGYP